MNWLARLKNTECTPIPTLQKLQKGIEGVSVVSVGTSLGGVEKSLSSEQADNDPAPDATKLCWPVGAALNSVEIDLVTARLVRFTDKGMALDDGEALAHRLVIRDREQDTRRVCLECAHLRSGHCGNWKLAGVAIRSRDSKLPADLTTQLQHCDGFY